MKALHLIPPVLALVGVGFWLGSTQVKIRQVEDKTLLLRKRIAEPRETGASHDTGQLQAGSDGGSSATKSLDWAEIGEALTTSQRGGVPDLRSLMKMQAKLMEMDRDEFITALEEIAALDLPAETRQGLEQMLVAHLVEKEPQLVLDRFLDRIHDSRGIAITWSLAQAFGNWIGKDPAAAKAWFDERIEAGDFDSRSLDGRNDARLRFESTFIGKLLESDPAAAAARLNELPEEQRADVFRQGGFSMLKEGSEMDFAALVREHIPEDERGVVLSQGMALKLHQGGYEAVSAFLDKIDATDGERQEVAKHSAIQKLRSLTGPGTEVKRRDVDEMRAWLAKESPEQASRVTGEALGSLWTGDFEQRAQVVEELSAEGGGDEVLVGFIESGLIHRQRELARRLAEKIEEPGERERLLERIGTAESEEH